MSATLEAALDYGRRDIAVTPLRGKVPILDRWPDRATTRGDEIRRLWQRWLDANVGAVIFESFVALDVDPRRGDDEALHDLEHDLGQLPETPRYLTGGADGGFRVLLAHPGGELRGEIRHVEVKRGRQQIVMPPSIHPETGRKYEWELGLDEIALAPLPPLWLDELRPASLAVPSPKAAEGVDWLLTRSPREYVRLLAGVEVDRDGKARCPLPGHTDRTPSFHAYEEPERGWHCYGCQRGGSIYTLAALLAGVPLPLRGCDFLSVQSALFDLYKKKLVR
jgi:hypothetical protein